MRATYANPSTEPARSRGPEVLAITRRLGATLLPWQHYALTSALAVEPDPETGADRLARRQVCMIVPRRNGKTDVVMWHALIACLILSDDRPGDPVVYLYTAHEALTAASTFKRMESWLMSHPDTAAMVARIYRGKGAEEIVFRNGARFLVRTRTGSAGRGLECHFLTFDEALELADDAHAALLPLVGRALRQGIGQVFYTSSAGHAGSTVLAGLRDTGRETADPHLCYMEWSAPREMDPYSEETWRLANPSYGSTFHGPENVAAGLTLPREDFGREYLGWWSDQAAAPFIPAGMWDATAVDVAPAPESSRPRVALGVEWQDYGRTACLVAVVATGPGTAWVETLARWENPAGLNPEAVAADVLGHVKATRARIVAGDGYTAGPILDFLAGKRVPVAKMTAAHIAAASQTLLLAVAAGRLTHPADPVMSLEVGNAGARPSGDGGTRLSRATAAGPSLSAFAIAAAAHQILGPAPAPPAIIAAG